MTSRWRILVVALVALVALAGAGIYLLHSRHHQQEAVRNAPALALTPLTNVESVPHIVFTNKALRDGYGDVAVVAMSDPAGPRGLTTTECDRVYAAQTKLSCLSSHPGVVNTYSAAVLNSPDMTTYRSLPLQGIPSRTRLSPDAKYVATTTFVAGDSYAGTSFSTRTIISTVSGDISLPLENFTLVHNGASIDPVDRNYWGVTFARDGDTFYVTVAWSGHTWLARGSISKRTITTLHEDAECPSLSPDGTRIVFKQRGSLPAGQWRLVEYDIATGKVTPLAETRSVDDQAEWINNSDVIYGLPRNGSQAAIDDVWEVPADGTGAPKLLIPEAWSPAVVP